MQQYRLTQSFRRIIAFGPESLLEAAFTAGADDYLKDPWNLNELIIRSGVDLLGSILNCGSMTLRHDGRQLYLDESILSLSPCKSKLLRILMDNPNHYIPLQTLVNLLNIESENPEKTLHVQVHGLRRKLIHGMKGLYGKELTIENSRLSGYRLKTACG